MEEVFTQRLSNDGVSILQAMLMDSRLAAALPPLFSELPFSTLQSALGHCSNTAFHLLVDALSEVGLPDNMDQSLVNTLYVLASKGFNVDTLSPVTKDKALFYMVSQSKISDAFIRALVNCRANVNFKDPAFRATAFETLSSYLIKQCQDNPPEGFSSSMVIIDMVSAFYPDKLPMFIWLSTPSTLQCTTDFTLYEACEVGHL